MIKSLATLFFSNSTHDKNHAFQKLFPQTYQVIFNSGRNQGYDEGATSAHFHTRREAEAENEGTLGAAIDRTARQVRNFSFAEMPIRINKNPRFSGARPTDTIMSADHKAMDAPVTWGQPQPMPLNGGPNSNIVGPSEWSIPVGFRLIDADKSPPEIVFRYTDGKLVWASQTLKNSYLSSKSPEYAIALAKYEQARRNGKKSSGFKAEMDAIEDEFLVETARGVADSNEA